MALIPTPSQTIGPFFGFALARPDWADLATAAADGQRIAIEGRVLDGAGQAVTDALLEIWQADAAGRYGHPEDRQQQTIDPGFRGFGRACTDCNGQYRFVTIRPGAVPGRANALQAPHINLGIFARGLLNRLVTRIYFEDEPANDIDPVLSAIDDPALRRTLLARREGGAPLCYRFDIVLQGEGETVFFDI